MSNFCGLKTGCGRFRNLSSDQREFLKQYLTEKQNDYLERGRLRDVVAMRELTVFESLHSIEQIKD